MAARTYQRHTRSKDAPDTAVRVVLRLVDDGVVADVEWPANTDTDGGSYLYPTYVPLALERAEDVCEHYRFQSVVVVAADRDLWDDAWGDLLD